MKTKRIKPVNLAARALRGARHQTVRTRKGKGSYKRNPKHKEKT